MVVCKENYMPMIIYFNFYLNTISPYYRILLSIYRRTFFIQRVIYFYLAFKLGMSCIISIFRLLDSGKKTKNRIDKNFVRNIIDE